MASGSNLSRYFAEDDWVFVTDEDRTRSSLFVTIREERGFIEQPERLDDSLMDV